jgi:hypothetical protein
MNELKDQFHHVVNFSGGLCSAWAAKRVVDRYGRSGVTLLFADTLIEDAELYEFNKQWSDYLGVPITRICEGLTPWELFRRKGIIANSRFPVCSILLKREPLDIWHRTHCLELNTVIYVGMDWEEGDRLAKMRVAKPQWRIEAPMQWEPIWDKQRMVTEAEKVGIRIPRLYRLGFPHNNCGGRCVAAGISHFVHLNHVLPDKNLEWEREEIYTQEVLKQRGIEGFTVLKDRRGGVKRPLSLRQLRERIESGEKFPRFEWGACGCSTTYDTDHQDLPGPDQRRARRGIRNT